MLNRIGNWRSWKSPKPEPLAEPTEITSPPLSLDEHNNTVFNVSFAPPVDKQPFGDLATASYDGVTRVWDVARCLTSTSKRVKHNLKGSLGGVWCCTYAQDLPALVTGCSKGTLCIYDVKKKYSQVARTLQAHGTSAVFSASVCSGGLLCTAGGDKNLKIWNMASLFTSSSGGELSLQHTLPGHVGDVVSCCFAPPGSNRGGLVIASGSEDKHIRIWDVERGECVQTVIGHRAEVCCVQYSPDASLLASASSDMSVRMNDPRQRHRCIEVLEGHSNSVYSLSWRRGSGYGLLATASQDGTVLLWDPRTWKCCRSIESHAGEVVCCQFSTDGNILATGSADMCAQLHRMRESTWPSEAEYLDVSAIKEMSSQQNSGAAAEGKSGSASGPQVMEVGSSTADGGGGGGSEGGGSARGNFTSSRSMLGRVGEGNRGAGNVGEEANIRKKLERFYMVYKPEKVENAAALARSYMKKGGGQHEYEKLNRDLMRVYNADLTFLKEENPSQDDGAIERSGSQDSEPAHVESAVSGAGTIEKVNGGEQMDLQVHDLADDAADLVHSLQVSESHGDSDVNQNGHFEPASAPEPTSYPSYEISAPLIQDVAADEPAPAAVQPSYPTYNLQQESGAPSYSLANGGALTPPVPPPRNRTTPISM